MIQKACQKIFTRLSKSANWEVKMIRNLLKGLKIGLQDIYWGQLKGLYLYGSYAIENADSESDIDILVILDWIKLNVIVMKLPGQVNLFLSCH